MQYGDQLVTRCACGAYPEERFDGETLQWRMCCTRCDRTTVYYKTWYEALDDWNQQNGWPIVLVD